MSFSFDKTGFPLVFLPELAIEVHLLPVTQVQFEHFWADAGRPDRETFDLSSASTEGERALYRRFGAGEREKLFVTGVLPEEAVAFARWMGEGFDVPTLDEWRAIYRALEAQPVSLCQPMVQSAADPARTILERLLAQLQAKTLLDLSLMRGALLEWVRGEGDAWLGRGQPRQSFFPNLFNPLSDKDDQVKPIQVKRSRYFGFRLVRRDRRPAVEMAVSAHAGQHIFTSVEKDQSPHGKEGFQTLFYTHSALSKSEAEDIETRLVYAPSGIEPVDRLFFTLSNGKIVVTQIVPLAEPDRFGRRGRYLAHSLVFVPQAFTRFGADPFRVYERFPFIADVEEALKGGHFEAGDMGVVVREMSTDPSHTIWAAGAWPAEELKKLSLLALQADSLARERAAVAFVGEPELVEDALKAAFLAVPTPLRVRCSFDTYFHRCSLANTYFWGVGLLEPPNDPRFILVDARSRQVAGDVAVHPQTAYEQWVVNQLEPDNLNLVAHWKDYAFALCEWLDGRGACDAPLVDEAPLDIIETTFQANARQVQALIHTRLLEEKQLPPRLVNRISEPAYQRMRPIEHYRRLRSGFELGWLVKILYDVYKAQDFRTPPHEEIQELGAVLAKMEHRALRALHACWSGQRPKLHRELERLDKDDYSEFVQIALRVGLLDDPLALVVPARGAVFLEAYLAQGQPRDLVALVKALLEAREAACLSRLAAHVAQLSAGELRSLQQIVKKRPDVPEAFQQAVDKALGAS